MANRADSNGGANDGRAGAAGGPSREEVEAAMAALLDAILPDRRRPPRSSDATIRRDRPMPRPDSEAI